MKKLSNSNELNANKAQSEIDLKTDHTLLVKQKT